MVDIRVSILVIVFITIITCNGIVTATSQCVYKETFPTINGTEVTIDLSTIVKFPITVHDPKQPKFSYKIDLCNPIKCNQDFLSECGCQLGDDKDGVPYQFSLGHFSTSFLTIYSLSPLFFDVHYKNGDSSHNIQGLDTARSAVFNFKYNATESDTMKMIDENNLSLEYTFEITGSHVRIGNGGKPSGGSVIGYIGIAVIILILVAVIIYLIVGGVYMYKLRGARGVEVVPHLNYWTEVPLLVKDGCVFTFGPLVRKVRRGQSYERI